MKTEVSLNEKNQEYKYYACNDGKRKHEISFHSEKGIKINKQNSDIEIVKDGDLYFLKWKKKKYTVEILEKNQNKYIIAVNGVSYNFSIETPISFKRMKYLEKTTGKLKKQEVSAPMPGKIIEVLTEENDSIKEGDPIFILEAMKMQNEILSHVTGKISKINVKQNDSVEKGAVLLEVE